MAAARYVQGKYEVISFTADAMWELRDHSGQLLVLDEDENRWDRVEPECERCGRYSTTVRPAPATQRWVCHDNGCLDTEQGGA
jgi:hypothetical protein